MTLPVSWAGVKVHPGPHPGRPGGPCPVHAQPGYHGVGQACSTAGGSAPAAGHCVLLTSPCACACDDRPVPVFCACHDRPAPAPATYELRTDLGSFAGHRSYLGRPPGAYLVPRSLRPVGLPACPVGLPGLPGLPTLPGMPPVDGVDEEDRRRARVRGTPYAGEGRPPCAGERPSVVVLKIVPVAQLLRKSGAPRP